MPAQMEKGDLIIFFCRTLAPSTEDGERTSRRELVERSAHWECARDVARRRRTARRHGVGFQKEWTPDFQNLSPRSSRSSAGALSAPDRFDSVQSSVRSSF